MTPNQRSALRALPVFNVQGWLRHVADLLEAGVVTLHHHQIAMDNSDLAINARFSIVDKKHLEMLDIADKHETQTQTMTKPEMRKEEKAAQGHVHTDS